MTKSNLLRLPVASPRNCDDQNDGTPVAIVTPPVKNPPQFVGSLETKRSELGGKLSGPQAERSEPRTYTWQSCSREARDILNYMRDVTPPGAKPPWRSSPSVTPIQRLLDDGIDAQDLVDLVGDASQLIRAGQQEARWWYPGNLFGPNTLERWIADVGAFEAAQAEAERRDAELAELEARAEVERTAAREAPRPPVRDLALHSIQKRCLAQRKARDERLPDGVFVPRGKVPELPRSPMLRAQAREPERQAPAARSSGA